MAHIVGEKGTDAQLTNASRTKVRFILCKKEFEF